MIPLSTTRVQPLSSALANAGENAEDWNDSPSFIASGGPVRAHLSAPGGSASVAAAGGVSTAQFRLIADPCTLDPGMRVRDLQTQVVYDVVWAQSRGEPIPYVVAGLTVSTASN